MIFYVFILHPKIDLCEALLVADGADIVHLLGIERRVLQLHACSEAQG